MQALPRSGGGHATVNSVLDLPEAYTILLVLLLFDFPNRRTAKRKVNRSANLAAHLRANRACYTLNVAKSWLVETPRFLLLFLQGTSLPSDQCLG